MGFTKENTARATHYLLAMDSDNLTALFFDLSSNDTKHLSINKGEWESACLTRKAVVHLFGVIELSRPHNETHEYFDTLFDGAPDWVVDARKSDKFTIWTDGDCRYMYIDEKEEQEPLSSSDEGSKLIIATRPKPIEKPIYWDGEQCFDAGMLYVNGGGVECEFVGNHAGIVIGRPTDMMFHNKNYLSTSDKSLCKPIDTRTEEEKTEADMMEQLTNEGIVGYDPIMLKILIAKIKSGKIRDIKYTGK